MIVILFKDYVNIIFLAKLNIKSSHSSQSSHSVSYINLQVMNDTASSYSSVLTAVSYQLNIYFGSFLLVAGNLGCMGNIIVFRSQAFHERAYSIYLVSEAMSDFIYFNFVLAIRVLQKGFQIPILTRYDILCKFRQFLTDWSNQVSFSFFAFATIDRLLSTQRENSE